LAEGQASVSRRYDAVQKRSLPVLIVGHAAFGALLGVAACIVAFTCGIADLQLFDTARDPDAALAFMMSVASLCAAGSGITAFIFISIERSQAD
jgi:hypothetical protein